MLVKGPISERNMPTSCRARIPRYGQLWEARILSGNFLQPWFIDDSRLRLKTFLVVAQAADESLNLREVVNIDVIDALVPAAKGVYHNANDVSL